MSTEDRHPDPIDTADPECNDAEARVVEDAAVGGRTSGWDRRLAWLPAVVLTAMALSQITCATTSVLTPWKGGGFGMFSTIDSIGRRSLRVFVITEGARRPVRLPSSAAIRVQRARGFPSRGALERLAVELEPAVLASEPDAEALFVEIWRTEFEAQTSSLRLVRWLAVRRDLNAGGSEEGIALELDATGDDGDD